MRRHLHYYTNLERPYRDVASLLAGDPGLWLPAPGESVEAGWTVELHADGALPRTLAAHLAVVALDDGLLSETGLLRRLSWRSATAENLVPRLEGDLELAPLAGGCQLSLMATYRPPLSVVGEVADRMLGYRVAEACARRFILDIAEHVEASAVADT